MQHAKTVTCLAALGALAALGTAQAVSYDDLAFHYAPVHYQDTDSSDYPSDYITAFDYDSDRVSTNNWDHRGNGQWPATVYYSVVESCTHYFISYAFYHPRDWTDTIFDQEHENDLEGEIIAVSKDGSEYGSLQGMLTVFHTDFFSFTPSGSPLRNGHETIDGTLSFETTADGVSRPKTVQEAKGHGLKAWPYASDFNGSANQDGIIYHPVRGIGGIPTSGNDRNVGYQLVDILVTNGMWSAALNDAGLSESQAQTFASWGTFKGDTSGGCGSGLKTCSTNSANTPWGWDDGNDGASYRGEFALDPAHLFGFYFTGVNFSQQYLHNRYLEDMRAAGYTSSNPPRGFPSQLDLNSLYSRLVSSCN